MRFNSENTMKTSSFTAALLTLISFTSISATINAQEISELSSISIEDVTMNIVEDARAYNNENRGDMRHAIYDYMLANGDLTQEQIDTLISERELIKIELDTLRDTGDDEALAARITELREERENSKEELRTYVDTHEDLAETISNYREEITEQRNDQDRRRNRDDRNDRNDRKNGN